MGLRVFGHSTLYTEEKGVPAIRIGGIRPGGIIDVILPVNPDPALVRMPAKIRGYYVPVTAHQVESPEALEAAGFPSGAIDVPASGGNQVIRVSGVKPGDYDVQLVLEYPEVMTETPSSPNAA